MEYVTAQGAEIPVLGFGTARMDTYRERKQATSAALDTGYRHIDTAQSYDSEDAVGDAITESGVDRSDVFITTKLSGDNRAHEDVIESTRASLDRLDTTYVDLLLIHAPNRDVPHEETLTAMNTLRDEDLVHHIGVSNFSVEETRTAIEISDAPIVTNQVEYHMRHRQDDLLSFCIDESVLLTAYSPLGVGELLDEPTLATIGDRVGKTPAQVAIRWLLQQPMVATIPMSTRPEHIRENIEVFDFELKDDEMLELFTLDGSIIDDLAAKLDQ